MYIHVMSAKGQSSTPRQQASLLSLPCACANLRRASRAVTQLYDSMLRPVGMRSSQFTLLKVLADKGPIRQGILGEWLALDSTTLTRSLGPLKTEGWIEIHTGDDQRERLVGLTTQGARQLHLADREWARAQKRLKKRIGTQQWQELLSLTHQVTGMVRSG